MWHTNVKNSMAYSLLGGRGSVAHLRLLPLAGIEPLIRRVTMEGLYPRYFFRSGVLFVPGETILPYLLASFQTTPLHPIDDFYYIQWHLLVKGNRRQSPASKSVGLSTQPSGDNFNSDLLTFSDMRGRL